MSLIIVKTIYTTLKISILSTGMAENKRYAFKASLCLRKSDSACECRRNHTGHWLSRAMD